MSEEKNYFELRGKIRSNDITIGVIGCGYIGMELIRNFGLHCNKLIGIDIDEKKIIELRNTQFLKPIETRIEDIEGPFNPLGPTTSEYLPIDFTTEFVAISQCDVIFIAVPTLLNDDNSPNFGAIKHVMDMIDAYMKKPSLIIIESSVSPGYTRNEIKFIENAERLCGIEFFMGYSPERIMPGNSEHNLENTPKIISAYSIYGLDLMDTLYNKVCREVISAETLEEAEAAKLIENSQRDVNIAFMNECVKELDDKDINHRNVFDLCSTHWNFKQYSPGLVGGDCIPVNPYYLWASEGIKNLNILSKARYINEMLPVWIIDKIYHIANGILAKKILILGGTYKSDVKLMNNSGILELKKELEDWSAKVTIYEPAACLREIDETGYDIVIIGTKSKWIIDKIKQVGIFNFYRKEVKPNKRVLIDLPGYYPNVIHSDLGFNITNYWGLGTVEENL